MRHSGFLAQIDARYHALLERAWPATSDSDTGRPRRKAVELGAVDIVTGETVHIVHEQRKNIGFRRLLATMSRTFKLGEYPRRKVLLLISNDRAHNARLIHKLLTKHKGHIQIEWLPTYSLELNPQEDTWQHNGQDLFPLS